MAAPAPVNQAIELMWLFAVAHLTQTNNEIIVPRNIVGMHGNIVLTSLSQRLGDLLGAPIRTIYDGHIDSFRLGAETNNALMPFINLETHEYLHDAIDLAVETGLKIPVQQRHIPRPPNSFILYRQHHHHAVTAANPGVQNTQISRIIADMWRKETPEVRAHFKELADQKKQRHAEVYPGYQYSPRRPGERLRRGRARVHTASVPFISSTQAGLDLINKANCESMGMIDVDGDFLDILADYGVLSAPSGLAPVPDSQHPKFEDLVDEQVDGVALETVRFPPLQGNEFDEAFPMAEMLELDGA